MRARRLPGQATKETFSKPSLLRGVPRSCLISSALIHIFEVAHRSNSFGARQGSPHSPHKIIRANRDRLLVLDGVGVVLDREAQALDSRICSGASGPGPGGCSEPAIPTSELLLRSCDIPCIKTTLTSTQRRDSAHGEGRGVFCFWFHRIEQVSLPLFFTA